MKWSEVLCWMFGHRWQKKMWCVVCDRCDLLIEGEVATGNDRTETRK